jgi:hypothetical protein
MSSTRAVCELLHPQEIVPKSSPDSGVPAARCVDLQLPIPEFGPAISADLGVLELHVFPCHRAINPNWTLAVPVLSSLRAMLAALQVTAIDRKHFRKLLPDTGLRR